MTLVLLRDDDANATTDPGRLAACYAPLLDAGFPIVLSVIPAVALDTLAPDGQRERFISADYPFRDGFEELTADSPLARWIRAHDGQIDAAVHGLNHRRVRADTEFGALTQTEARGRIERGIEILHSALQVPPQGFVAPWDALSGPALKEASRHFQLVSTSWVERSRLPLSAWPAHVAERLGRRDALRVGSAWVLRHRGGKVTPETDPAALADRLHGLVDGADVGVVVLHHWMFWQDTAPHPVIVALADALRRYRPVGIRDALRHLNSLPAWRQL